jgi:hypothetical protein
MVKNCLAQEMRPSFFHNKKFFLFDMFNFKTLQRFADKFFSLSTSSVWFVILL